MNKRIKGIKEHPMDIAKSVAKRVFKIGSDKASERRLICNNCPSNVEDKALGGRMCNECWCNLSTLVYSTEKGCELDKW